MKTGCYFNFAYLTFILLAIWSCSYETLSDTPVDAELTIGIVSDVHADMLPDNLDRMERFISDANSANSDMIIQLGDFCRPNEKERMIYDSWNEFKGEKFHVLGNHDMDFNSKEDIVKYLRMPGPYYSFDQDGYHFIILDANYLYVDGNYINYDKANYYVDSEQRAYINPEQLKWLKEDLSKTKKKTLVFSHQSLINVLWGIKNRFEVQEIFEEANKKAGFTKVIACFNGHDHIDFHREINGIQYFEINSIGYQWIGDGYVEKNCFDSLSSVGFNHLDKIAIYSEPLYAFLTINNDEIVLKGIQSEWYCSTPLENGIYKKVYGGEYSPEISDYVIKLN